MSELLLQHPERLSAIAPRGYHTRHGVDSSLGGETSPEAVVYALLTKTFESTPLLFDSGSGSSDRQYLDWGRSRDAGGGQSRWAESHRPIERPIVLGHDGRWDDVHREPRFTRPRCWQHILSAVRPATQERCRVRSWWDPRFLAGSVLSVRWNRPPRGQPGGTAQIAVSARRCRGRSPTNDLFLIAYIQLSPKSGYRGRAAHLVGCEPYE